MKIKEGKQIGFVIKKGINVDKQFQYGKCIFEQGFDSANVGVSEVTLNGTIGKNLKSYTIKGNTVQNGTPTPDNPIEVLGVGDRTANLIDVNASESGGITDTGELIVNPNTWRSKLYYDIDTTLNYVASKATQTIRINYYDASKNHISREGITQETYRQLTVPSNARYFKWTLYDNYGIPNIQAARSIKPMVNTGSTALPYEPYGYKIPVTTLGKNLFDSTTLEGGIYLAANGNKYGVITDGVRAGTKIEVFPNTAYTLSVYSSENVSLRILEWSNGTFKNQTPKYNVSGSVSLTVTTTAETTEIAFNIEGANGQYATSIMLNEGSTALPYEPYREPVVSNVYLDEPLYSGDYIKLNTDDSGVVHRAWRKLVFDGTEVVSYNARNDTRGRWTVTIPTPNGTTTPENVICTHFNTVDATAKPLSEGGICMRSTGVDVVVGGLYTDIGVTSPSDSTTIVNAVKAYLAEQYAAGTPVTVIYQLATPTDTPITLPNIPTLKALPPLHTYDGATTVISVDTTVSPSKFDAAYKSNVSNPYKIEYHTADNKGFASADGAVFTTRY